MEWLCPVLPPLWGTDGVHVHLARVLPKDVQAVCSVNVKCVKVLDVEGGGSGLIGQLLSNFVDFLLHILKLF